MTQTRTPDRVEAREKSLKPGPLRGLLIWVTRPRHQADAFIARIAANGGKALAHPTIVIAPPTDLDAIADTVAALDQFTDAVFVSANAAEHFARYLHAAANTVSVHLRVSAIGEKTASQLLAHGLPVHLRAPSPFTSEALLALPEFGSLHGRRVLIVRGGSGRELLQDTFTLRGAEVTLLDVYRRVCPPIVEGEVEQALRARQIDVITLTSTEGLRNLIDMTPSDTREALLQTPILVGSRRMVETCRMLGFRIPPIVADDPSDESMFNRLIAWAASQSTNR